MKHRPMYEWFRETKPRRILAASLATVILLWIHTAFAIKNTVQVIWRNYAKCWHNLRVIWLDYVPNKSAALAEDPDCV